MLPVRGAFSTAAGEQGTAGPSSMGAMDNNPPSPTSPTTEDGGNLGLKLLSIQDESGNDNDDGRDVKTGGLHNLTGRREEDVFGTGFANTGAEFRPAAMPVGPVGAPANTQANRTNASPTVARGGILAKRPSVRFQCGEAEAAVTDDFSVGKDPQRVFPPNACIFVANLPAHESDAALEAAVKNTFGKFGIVYPKIRRDNANYMPFAFCQYTNEADAQRALTRGSGETVLGRPCRVEKAKANVEFVIYRYDGKTMTDEDAIEQLGPFGDIESVDDCHDQTLSLMGIGCPAKLVKFAMFDAQRDINTAFSINNTYKVRAFKERGGATPVKGTPFGATPIKRTPFGTTPNNNNKRTPGFGGGLGMGNVEMRESDRRSIYIGNLPKRSDIDEGWIRELVQECGTVRSVVLKHTNALGVQQKMFAFVEFDSQLSVEVAINELHELNVSAPDDEDLIKVERKGFGYAPRSVSVRHQRSFDHDWRKPNTQATPSKQPRHAKSYATLRSRANEKKAARDDDNADADEGPSNMALQTTTTPGMGGGFGFAPGSMGNMNFTGGHAHTLTAAAPIQYPMAPPPLPMTTNNAYMPIAYADNNMTVAGRQQLQMGAGMTYPFATANPFLQGYNMNMPTIQQTIQQQPIQQATHFMPAAPAGQGHPGQQFVIVPNWERGFPVVNPTTTAAAATTTVANTGEQQKSSSSSTEKVPARRETESGREKETED